MRRLKTFVSAPKRRAPKTVRYEGHACHVGKIVISSLPQIIMIFRISEKLSNGYDGSHGGGGLGCTEFHVQAGVKSWCKPNIILTRQKPLTSPPAPKSMALQGHTATDVS